MGIFDTFKAQRAEAQRLAGIAKKNASFERAKNWMHFKTNTAESVSSAMNTTGAKLGEASVRPFHAAGEAMHGTANLAGKAWESNIAHDISETSQKVFSKTKSAGAKTLGTGWKIGKYGALGAAAVGGIVLLANMGKKKVTAEPSVDLGDTVAMANFDAPTAQMTASGRPTLMGLDPIEGEHVNRLGKGGQQLGFRDVAPPRAALDAGFDDVSTVPTR